MIAKSFLRCQAHYAKTGICFISQFFDLRKAFQPVPATRRNRRLKQKTLIHHDKHKICPAANRTV
jgi:hypothetical protein